MDVRPIDANALAEVINEMIADYTEDNALTFFKLGIRGGLNDAYRAVINFPTLDYVPLHQWINVNDRLPERECVALVCGKRGGIYTAEYRMFDIFGKKDPHWHKLNSKSHWCEPTHWMPLPKPPKEEEK